MSNERIDLTQFEVKKYEEEYDEMQDMAPTEYLDLVLDMRRKLIAELKRCYEEIDKLRRQPVSISCEHCSHVYEEEYLHEMLEMGPNGECVMCLEEASE